MRGRVEHIAARFLDFTTGHVFARYLGQLQPPTESESAEVAALVRRLRPLAQQTVGVELARVMRLFATRQLRRHLASEKPSERLVESCSVLIPASAMRAVDKLVGPEQAPAFITVAAEREVQSRTLDALAARRDKESRIAQ